MLLVGNRVIYSDAKSLKHCSIGDTYISKRNRHCDWLTGITGADSVDEISSRTHLHEKAYVGQVTNFLRSRG